MAVLTPLTLEDAKRVARAHGFACTALEPIPAGSVNSNFVLELGGARAFLRVYEEQECDGVAYEWALLDHLEAAGIPTARRLGDVAPGEVRVEGKCTALFAWSEGEMSCQRAVTPARAQVLGATIARAHEAGRDFGWRRRGRFQRSDIEARMRSIPRDDELSPVLDRLEVTRREIDAAWPRALLLGRRSLLAGRRSLPSGVVHGDLFRDNLLWDGDAVSAIIDWESASDHFFAYDLAVTMLAWCMGDGMDWGLASAMVRGYESERRLSAEEWGAFRLLARSAALRFCVTRITDFHLRQYESGGGGVHKDYRRFVARLDAVESLSDGELRARLAPDTEAR